MDIYGYLWISMDIYGYLWHFAIRPMLRQPLAPLPLGFQGNRTALKDGDAKMAATVLV